MEYDSKLDTIPDEDEQEQTSAPQHVFRSAPTPRRSSTTSSLQRIVTATRLGSETPSIEGNKSSSPSTSTGTASSLTPATYQFPEASLQAGGYGAEWSHLPQELRYFLGYFAENITHYHYGVVNDSHDFFRTILPSMAARNEALLYSVVGFAAYHHTLRNPQGKMEQFLKYYNKAVRLLLGFLKRKERHNLATLLTILQLATIEVKCSPVPGHDAETGHLTDRQGVSGRLGKLDGPPESRLRGPEPAVDPPVGDADTDGPHDPVVVLPLRHLSQPDGRV